VVSDELTQRNRDLLQQLREREHMEVELHQALKLEAVGQLASGIAHEINTPIQYVGDSVGFVKDAFGEVRGLLAWYRTALCACMAGQAAPSQEALDDAEQEADIAYALEQIPAAVERTLDGVRRVASLVGAMKDFAHPDACEKLPADLNVALQSTALVASNEIRRVADVKLELGALPLVVCHVGAVNQVFLNVLVNAAHAIAGAPGERGLITVRTRVAGDSVEVAVTDTGTGIPAAVRDRIFEPFFTTKDVGRGTGQGLAIARSIVRDKHAGSITFETTEGAGTTFIIRLPIVDPAPPQSGRS
ncbi:MAG: ATP-binding protein, partial [Gemmatimonadota bacterium]